MSKALSRTILIGLVVKHHVKVLSGQQILLGKLECCISIGAKKPLGQAVVPGDLSNAVFLAIRPCALLAPVGLSGLLALLLAFGASALEGSRRRLSPGGHDEESKGARRLVELEQDLRCCEKSIVHMSTQAYGIINGSSALAHHGGKTQKLRDQLFPGHLMDEKADGCMSVSADLRRRLCDA